MKSTEPCNQRVMPSALENQAIQCRLLARKFALEKHNSHESSSIVELVKHLDILMNEIKAEPNVQLTEAALEFRGKMIAQIGNSNVKTRRAVILQACDNLR